MNFFFKRRSGGIAKAIVFLFIAQWIASPFHFKKEIHRYCFEHNQYEHSGDHHAGERKNELKRHSNPNADEIKTGGGVDRVSEHEACAALIIAKTASGATLKNCDKSSNDVPSFFSNRFDYLFADSKKYELLFLAPKNSPPSA